MKTLLKFYTRWWLIMLYSKATKCMGPKDCKNRCAFHKKQPFSFYNFLKLTIYFSISKIFFKNYFPSLGKSYHQKRAQQNFCKCCIGKIQSTFFQPTELTGKWKLSNAFWKLIPANCALLSFSSQDASL